MEQLLEILHLLGVLDNDILLVDDDFVLVVGRLLHERHHVEGGVGSCKLAELLQRGPSARRLLITHLQNLNISV